MKKIPDRSQAEFMPALEAKHVPPTQQGHYLKWLRYYLDFCEKYGFDPHLSQSLPQFIQKLGSKNQTPAQQQQAQEAVQLFLETRPVGEMIMETNALDHSSEKQSVSEKHQSYQDASSKAKTPKSSNKQTAINAPTQTKAGEQWEKAMLALSDAIKVRHYSPKTLESYANWVAKFRSYTRWKELQALDTSDVKPYLTSLAVEKYMSASSQNQAFNALLFFFRHVLGKEFGIIDGVVRAKRRPYIPVVLTRPEVDTIVQQLNPPYDLVVQLLYGCGLRLFECLNLRVNNFNFDFGPSRSS